jgi:predicted nucleic acid-binding protein
MDIVARIGQRHICLDTAPIIYFIERHPRFHPLVRPIFESLSLGSLAAVTSVVTLLEVLVQPLREGQGDLAREYRSILTESRGLQVVPVTIEAAEVAAALRARHGIRVADAIQAASGIQQGCGVFITNDARLKCLTEFSEIIVLDDELQRPS